ncbi:MAG: hypothetical protein AAGB51_14285 [Planctomycetota bacterium]
MFRAHIAHLLVQTVKPPFTGGIECAATLLRLRASGPRTEEEWSDLFDLREHFLTLLDLPKVSQRDQMNALLLYAFIARMPQRRDEQDTDDFGSGFSSGMGECGVNSGCPGLSDVSLPTNAMRGSVRNFWMEQTATKRGSSDACGARRPLRYLTSLWHAVPGTKEGRGFQTPARDLLDRCRDRLRAARHFQAGQTTAAAST